MVVLSVVNGRRERREREREREKKETTDPQSARK
jgi:hypothetical protein